MAIATINPTTGETEKTFDALSDDQIEKALQAADSAAHHVRTIPIEERANWLKNTASILRTEKDSLGAMMTREMGKTFASAKAEVEKCAWVCEFYAEQGPSFLEDRIIETSAERSFARYLPIGPVLAVMPWNFPLWQVFRFAAPALLAGNVGLLKHASNVPQCALAIEDLFRRGGAPDGAFTTLLIGGDQVEGVLKDNRVRAATLTGSEGAGRAVAATAGDALKKVVLELGGSDPLIVMPSADLEDAVSHAIRGRLLNNGQSCIAAKRFIIHSDIYDEFRDRFAAALEDQTIGDPMEDTTDIGPLATSDIRDELAEQVDKTVSAGGRRVTGARPIEGAGWFYQPGLLEAVPETSPAASEELFGPVATLFKAPSLDRAIEIANGTRFGLGSAIFTKDERDVERAFNELDAGATFVNAITASDPRLPFGGVKASGHGRELAADGIREFLNLKTCSIGASS